MTINWKQFAGLAFTLGGAVSVPVSAHLKAGDKVKVELHPFRDGRLGALS